jgi:hypothetical protein
VKRLRATIACAAAILFPSAAGAIDLTPSPARVATATADGATMERGGDGYTIAPYLLFGVDDALHITDDDAIVEAVTLGTPYERLRFAAYLRSHQGLSFDAQDANEEAAADDGRIALIVSVHSRTERDRDFMTHFGAGVLVGPDGTTLAATNVRVSAPVIDAYYRLDGTVLHRWLGQVTYVFDLRTNATWATASALIAFAFTDDRGATHRYVFNPNAFR